MSFQGIALTAYLPYLKGRGFTRSFDDFALDFSLSKLALQSDDKTK
ncbi:hypothetical protein BTN49_1360 [Candidatus Enterovibrio escicola]|uniref:Uncharacterized protein n=1 Tax=Candidatus Enterovibrio escicola TaxID=1927127 RepID=A0A2A5T4D8_9GAMM|nr:hypothetical protein BTN49_1360 [Candidatus Enterovibrio escacola]